MAIQKITAAVLGNNAVTAANVAAGTLSAADIADNSITAAKISASTSPTLGGLTVDGTGTAQITSTAASTLELIRSGTAGQISSLIMKDGGNVQNRINSSGGALEFEYGASNINAIKIDNNGDISFYEDTGTTAKLFWDASAERLGIGTSNPTAPLDLISNSGAVGVYIRGRSSDNNGSVYFTSNANTATEYGFIQGRSTDLRIQGFNNGLILQPNSGNVGIGTSAPSYKLSLQDDSTSAYPLVLENGNIGTAGVHTGIRFGYSGNTYQKGAIIFEGQDAAGRGKMYFAMEGTADTSNADETDAKLTIDYSGNVGMGETNPQEPLVIKNSPQMLLHLHRNASTPGIKFTNGGSTAGTYGYFISDEDEFNIGRYDGSTSTSWLQGINNVVRVGSPISSVTDSGTRQYSHLCTGSFYSGTGAIVIETNIPSHNSSNNSNMFSLKIRGYAYDLYKGGQIDLNVGCYAGEGNYYNASYSATNMPYQWIDEIYFAKNDTTGKVAVILGTVTSNTNYEIAVTDFIQGFLNVNETYADGWSMTRVTSLSNYSAITDCKPVHQSGRLGFHYYLSSSTSLSNGVNALALTTKLWERGNGYDNSNGRFTCRNDGAYLFTYALQMDGSTTNQSYISAEVRVNGGNRFIGGWFNSVNKGGTSAYDAATGSCVLDLVSGDYVDFYYELSQAATALGGVPGYTFWSGVFLG